MRPVIFFAFVCKCYLNFVLTVIPVLSSWLLLLPAPPLLPQAPELPEALWSLEVLWSPEVLWFRERAVRFQALPLPAAGL